jgi:hypothetical protein
MKEPSGLVATSEMVALRSLIVGGGLGDGVAVGVAAAVGVSAGCCAPAVVTGIASSRKSMTADADFMSITPVGSERFGPTLR